MVESVKYRAFSGTCTHFSLYQFCKLYAPVFPLWFYDIPLFLQTAENTEYAAEISESEMPPDFRQCWWESFCADHHHDVSQRSLLIIGERKTVFSHGSLTILQ